MFERIKREGGLIQSVLPAVTAAAAPADVMMRTERAFRPRRRKMVDEPLAGRTRAF